MEVMSGTFRQTLNMLATRHRPGAEPNVFLHSLPRSGSTWLMELILTQPGFRACNEPLNLRKPADQEHLGVSDWADLHRPSSKAKLHDYFEGLCSDRLRDPRLGFPSPLSKFYRPITRRIVFKVIHAAEEHINWLAETFNGKVLFLLRHPIPVSLSRKVFPKLDTILSTEFAQFFTESQLALAQRIIRGDNKLARGVLDWCLRNSVALRSRTNEWTIVSYEQLVVNPTPAIDRISKNLGLPNPEWILKRLPVPSQSTRQSNPDTQEKLHANRDRNDQSWLVEKWRTEVTDGDLSMADEIMAAFDLGGVYRMTGALPERRYWID